MNQLFQMKEDATIKKEKTSIYIQDKFMKNKIY